MVLQIHKEKQTHMPIMQHGEEINDWKMCDKPVN